MSETFEYTRSWENAEDFPLLNFSKNWENPADYPTIEPDEAQVRRDMQSLHDEVKDYLNDVLIPKVIAEDATVDAWQAEEAERVANEIERVAGENARIAAEKDRVNETSGIVAKAAEHAASAEAAANKAAQAALGQIPDGSLEKVKFAPEVQQLLVGQQFLINSHFGKGALVDQRGGYVVPPNTPYFVINEATQGGVTSKYYPVLRTLHDGTWSVLNVDGVEYNVPSENTVRGYTGAGYCIDMWEIINSNIVVLVEDDGILVINAGSATGYIKQTIEQDVTGRIVCLSFLTDDNLYHNYGTGVSSQSAISIGHIGKTGVWGAALQYDGVRFYAAVAVHSGQRVKFKAANLELGTEQTLAHQDENGKLVLNEIPSYAEELAKCQDYLRVFSAWSKFAADYYESDRIIFSIPAKMRANPTPVGFTVYSGFTAQSGFTFAAYDNGNNIVIVATKAGHGLTSAWIGSGALDAVL